MSGFPERGRDTRGTAKQEKGELAVQYSQSEVARAAVTVDQMSAGQKVKRDDEPAIRVAAGG